MLLKLSVIEIKHQFKRITFYVFVLLTALFVFIQIREFEMWSKHPDEQEDIYLLADQMIGDPKQPDEMATQKGVYELLQRAVESKKIMVQGLIINKEKRLSEEQIKLIKEVMQKISPEGKEIWTEEDLHLSGEEFEKIIDDLDEKLGGRTVITKERRISWMPYQPKSHEKCVEDKERLVELGFTSLMAKMFSDYYGISLSMLTVFLSAFIFYRDRRSRILELICSRPVGGVTYVFSKFIGMCIPIFASIMAVACIPTFYAIKMKLEGYNVNIFAYFSTFAVWLFPGVMFVVALSMMVSLLSNSPIAAIGVQYIIFFLTVMPLYGDYSLSKVFIRHNTLEPLMNPQAFYINRIFIFVMSIAITFITAGIWQRKRRRIGERIK